MKIGINRDLLVLFVLLFVFLLLPSGLHNNHYAMHLLIVSLIWAALAANWDLMLGYCGIFSFAQIALFVVGAYASGMTTIYLGISPWLGILVGGLAAGVTGFLIGLPCLRLAGLFVTVLTFAFHLALHPVIDSAMGRVMGTGGQMGLLNIPVLQFLGHTFTYTEKTTWYYVAVGICFLIFFVVYKIIHSPIGLAFSALHDAEPFAKSLGVDEYKYKLVAFAISSFLSGIAGAFYAHYTGLISTRLLGIDLFLLLLFMVIVGGIGRFPGAIIAAPFVIFLNDALRPLEFWRLVVFGAIVILFVIFAPKGLRGLIDSIISYVKQTSERRHLKGVIK